MGDSKHFPGCQTGRNLDDFISKENQLAPFLLLAFQKAFQRQARHFMELIDPFFPSKNNTRATLR